MDLMAMAGNNWSYFIGVDEDIADTDVLTIKPSKWRRIAIMATISFSEINAVDIQRMFEAGLNIIKFRMATSTMGDKIRILQKINQAEAMCCEKYGVSEWPVATAVVLKTTVKKTGLLKGDKYEVKLIEGNEVILTNNTEFMNKCDANLIFVENPMLVDENEVGNELSIDTDEIVLKCIEKIDNNSIKCVVTETGYLRNLRTLCSRSGNYYAECLTPVDYQLINFAIENNIDVIALDYCRDVNTLKKIKKLLVNADIKPLIFVGISTPSGVENIDDIIKECDGIEITRDILPYELSHAFRYRWMQIQKWVFAKCQLVGKPCFLTGAVFRSTVTTGIVFERELSDVTNALIDGATGLCIKDTDNIDYTVDVMKLINEICCQTQPLLNSKVDSWIISKEIKYPANAAITAVFSSINCASDIGAQVIIIPTVSGKTVKYLFWLKPTCLVITISTNTRKIRNLQTYMNILPLKLSNENGDFKSRIAKRIDYAINHAVQRGLLDYGDAFVILRRGSEQSSYCDTVIVEYTTTYKKTNVECDG